MLSKGVVIDPYVRHAEAITRLDPAVRGTRPIDLEEEATEAFTGGTVGGVVRGATEAISDIADELSPSSP